MKKIFRYSFLIVASCILAPYQTSFAQVCTPIFNDGLGVGNAIGFPLQDYLNVRHFITCPPQVPPNGAVTEPALRLDYDDELYFGQLSMVRNTFRNSLLANSADEGDLILRNSCHGDDIIVTTQSTTGEIRFATTPGPGLGAACPSLLPPNNEPAQSGSLNDKERMTILPNGNVGIGTEDPIYSVNSTPLPIKSTLQIGNINIQPTTSFNIPNGTWGSVAYNTFWDHTLPSGPRRHEAGSVNGIVFQPTTNIGVPNQEDGGVYLFAHPHAPAADIPGQELDKLSGTLLLMPHKFQLYTSIWKDDPNIPNSPGIDPHKEWNDLMRYTYPSAANGGNGVLYIRDQVLIGKEALAVTPPFGGAYKLAVNGSILAKEIVVDARAASWADFVFAPDYQLLPLYELEKHIKTKHHLPDIPTAKQVEDNGIALGNLQGKLLQKIEELTLYVIDLKKENDRLSARIEKIEKTH